MMLVGRSYQNVASRKEPRRSDKVRHSSKPPRKANPSADETRGFGWRPASYEDHLADWRRVEERRRSTSSPKANLAPPAVAAENINSASNITPPELTHGRSKPLAIPRNGRGDTQLPPTAQRPRAGRDHRHNPTRGATSSLPRTLPASVATLLAVTSIPKKKTFPRPKIPEFPRMSSQELVEHWKQLDLEAHLDPTMEVLLSPPDTDDFLPRTASYERFMRSPPSPSRSSSSDSMSSFEAEGSMLSWNMPQMPRLSRRTDGGGNTTKERIVSSPPSVDCAEDHPLLVHAEIDPPPQHGSRIIRASTSVSSSPLQSLPTQHQKHRSPSVSKSALSLSLSALRTAARTFSNFAAPSLAVLPDDHLSRGLFGSQGQHPAYPAEMRPKPLDGVPTPAMRRYMNPSHTTAPGEFHLHGASWDHLDLEAAAAASISVMEGNASVVSHASPAVIKMQTYVRVAPASTRRKPRLSASEAWLSADSTRPPPHTATSNDADEAMHTTPPQAPNRPRREPRENADFLRVCVLEMNMRRAGKLEAVSVGGIGAGKARFWLPPRTDGYADEEQDPWRGMDSVMVRGRRVPKRWLGVNVQ